MESSAATAARHITHRPFNRILPTVVILAALMAVASAGCGSGAAVLEYTTAANGVLAQVNTSSGALKATWDKPASELGDTAKLLSDFRKSLSDSQEMIDSTDPPVTCRDLNRTLRLVVDTGRTLADIYSPFADYMGDLAPVAQKIQELSDAIEQLEEAGDVPSTIAGLTDKADEIDNMVRSVVPPPVFVGMHEELLQFVAGVDEQMWKAYVKLGLDKEERAGYEEESIPAEEGEEEYSDRERRSQYRQVAPFIEDIPAEWKRFDGAITSMLNTVREVSGIKPKNAELERIIGEGVLEIQELEKEYE